jgi:hypothetical protein
MVVRRIQHGGVHHGLEGPVGVGDELRPHRDSLVDRGGKVLGCGVVGLYEQDAGTRGGRRHHVQVERYLPRPVHVGFRVVGPAPLVHLAEAAVGRGAGRKAVLGPVDAEVDLGGGVVEGVDDGDGLPGTTVGGEVVCVLDLGGAEPLREYPGLG